MGLFLVNYFLYYGVNVGAGVGTSSGFVNTGTGVGFWVGFIILGVDARSSLGFML